MAHEIRVVRVRERPEREVREEGPVQPEPRSTAEARRLVEESRGRISATLDAIEDRLDAKKEELKEKANVLRPIREQVRRHHWRSLGIAFGAGLLLAMMLGGEEEEERERERFGPLDEDEREELRRWREKRRARLEHRLARRRERAEARERAGSRGFAFGEYGRMIGGAVLAGLGDRFRRRSS